MNYIEYILEKTAELNPIHAKKIRANIVSFDDVYYQHANAFYNKYIAYLKTEDKTFDYAIKCYLDMIADMTIETIKFHHTGKYSSSTFAEVNERVYGNPEIMEYYMHGLIMSQFIWKHHYDLFHAFIQELPQYINQTKSYLEIGAGHGLFLSKSLEIFDKSTSFDVVDISKTSIDLAKKFTNDSRVNFTVKNVFDFTNESKYDFIVMGEVLEHVEDPVALLSKLSDLLNTSGRAFITTPTNAPTIDHLYLFKNLDEIRNLIDKSGFEIETEMSFLSENVSPEKVEKFKVSTLFGAFLKKK